MTAADLDASADPARPLAGAPPADGAPARQGGGRRPSWLGWALAALILLGCVLFVDLGEVLSTLRRLTPTELAVLLLIATADRLLMGYKWALLLRGAGVATPTPRVVRYFYQASFAGAFMPSHVGGDVLRAWWVMRDSGIKHPVFASLLVERLLGFVSAANWAILGAAALMCHLDPERTMAWVGLGLLAFAAANAGFVLALSAPVHRLVLGLQATRRRSRVLGIAHDFYAAFAGFASQPRRLALNALLTLVEQGLQMLLYVGIALSIDAVPALVPFLAATALFTFVMRLPVAPDGWGVGELTAIAAYGLIGVGAAEAFSVSAIGHLVPMLALSPGIILLLAAGRGPRAAMAGAAAARSP